MTISRAFTLLSITVAALLSIHCSNVAFKQKSSDQVKQGNAGGDDATGNIEQPGSPNPNPNPSPTPGPTPNPNPNPSPTPGPTPTPTPTPTPGPTPVPQEYPHVSFYGPTCVRTTACLVQFTLDRAYTANVDFDWRTNDTIYTTPATPIWGQPGVHYVSTNGHIQFKPGETVKKVYVQNINPDPSLAINIGIIMSTCQYGGRADSCKLYFNQ